MWSPLKSLFLLNSKQIFHCDNFTIFLLRKEKPGLKASFSRNVYKTIKIKPLLVHSLFYQMFLYFQKFLYYTLSGYLVNITDILMFSCVLQYEVYCLKRQQNLYMILKFLNYLAVYGSQLEIGIERIFKVKWSSMRQYVHELYSSPQPLTQLATSRLRGKTFFSKSKTFFKNVS